MLPFILRQALGVTSDTDSDTDDPMVDADSLEDDDDANYATTSDEDQPSVQRHTQRHTQQQTRSRTTTSVIRDARNGTQLLANGEFGAATFIPGLPPVHLDHSLSKQLLSRELCGSLSATPFQTHLPVARSTRTIHPATKTHIGQHFIPNDQLGKKMTQFQSRAYSGQFSEDGEFFFACCQDFTVHLFRTQDPSRFMHYKTIAAQIGRWTITDASLSADNKFVAYSSITPVVHVASTEHENEAHFALDFSMGRFDGFGIWSLRFSGDGRELIAGTSNSSIFVYDVEAHRVVVAQEGHADDVNAVSFAETGSTHVFFSGSDDSLIKVWDRRSMRNGHGTAAGVLVGHTEGITYVASKGDGRYCLSNGKDQTMKLWDIRMLMSEQEVSQLPRVDYRASWDYRYMRYPRPQTFSHPQDKSVCTYRGHSVHKTLIRCHFSPLHTTGQRYLYSGSDDGCVHVYALDGTKVAVLNATDVVSRGSADDVDDDEDDAFEHMNWFLGGGNRVVVRDASWHPHAPFMTATTWNGRGGVEGGVIGFKWKEPQANVSRDSDTTERATWAETTL
jgi:WD repeat-containing protein 23